MKKTEVELPDAIYQQVEEMAGMLHLTVAELLCKATGKRCPGLGRAVIGDFLKAGALERSVRRLKSGACLPTKSRTEAR